MNLRVASAGYSRGWPRRRLLREMVVEMRSGSLGPILARKSYYDPINSVISRKLWLRAEDTLETLKEKVRKAAILGTLQATLTDFRYLRNIWKRNTEEEALLGCILTGIMDHPVLSGICKMA